MLLLSPLQIVKYGLWRSCLVVVEDLIDGGEAAVKVDMETAISFSDEGVWNLLFKMNTSEESRGQYEFDFELRGKFRLKVPPKLTEEGIVAAAHFVAKNGGALLYTALREHVLTLTSRSIPGPLTIPVVDAKTFDHENFTEEMIGRALTYYTESAAAGVPGARVATGEAAAPAPRKKRSKK